VLIKFKQMNRRRSFLPLDNSKSNVHKKMKFSTNEYADISYKNNSSAAKSISSCDTDDTMSETMIELIKDIERINIDRNAKINEMHYPNKKENLKVKVKNTSFIAFKNDKPTNNFNFKKVFEKIQQEKKSNTEKKYCSSIASSMSSLNSSQNENPPLNLKNILFDKKTRYDKEKLNRNIRNITSLKKSIVLNNKNQERIKINEKDEILKKDDEATPTFTKDEFCEDSFFNDMKEFKRTNFFLPKQKSSVNFSLFTDLNPNPNSRNMIIRQEKK
jgi:hypothetical protein